MSYHPQLHTDKPLCKCKCCKFSAVPSATYGQHSEQATICSKEQGFNLANNVSYDLTPGGKKQYAFWDRPVGYDFENKWAYKWPKHSLSRDRN